VMIYRRINDTTFRRIVLVLLVGMGLSLIDKGFHIWGELFMPWHFHHAQFGHG